MTQDAVIQVLTMVICMIIGAAMMAAALLPLEPAPGPTYADGWNHKHDLKHNRELGRCIAKELER